ncbi:hypothetical protein UFOVP247_9 [uncultured Caudovirales phage]|uniref:Uncharacterized protein n=1 Tax=uncultured Caudovirales phage TaxID=2100421 RepID=A0A6J7WRE0_9CAUD|nr:hypothetical protein UFOVP247_9 [uncultured Caudovirales phage]
MTLMSPEDVKYYQTKLDKVLQKDTIDSWTYVKVLQHEIEHLKSQFQDHDTGHLKTTVNVLEERIKELLLK